MQPQSACALEQQSAAALCWQRGVTHMKHFKWHTWSKSRTPKSYKLRTIGQLSCILITQLPTQTVIQYIFPQIASRTNIILWSA